MKKLVLNLMAMVFISGFVAAQEKRPNILFIFSDDHAPHAIGAYGSVINETPNIDRIAREGAILRHNVCGNSICGPSRATILTGLHSHANGFMTNRDTFDGNQRTFPKLVQRAGYTTAMIGKWHLKTEPQGFDYWDVLPGQGAYYNPDFISADGKRKVFGYNTDIVTDLGIKWMQEQRDPDKPFVLMCQFKAPHRTWMPNLDHLELYKDGDIPEPSDLFDDYSGRTSSISRNEASIAKHLRPMYDLMLNESDWPKDQDERNALRNLGRLSPEQRRLWDAAFAEENAAYEAANLTGDDRTRWNYQRYIKNYLRSVASVDDNVGRLLDYLDWSGLAENTIVIYSSDQGFYLGDHGLYDKRWMYEESLGMPFVARWPGHIEPGTDVKSLTQNIDFAPTILEIAGAEVPKDMHGRSFLPLLKGEMPDDWRDAIYYHYYEKGVHNVEPHEGVRTDRYKLIHFYEIDEWEFFDLETDPDEMQSVYGDRKYRKEVAALKKRLDELKVQYAVPTD